MQRPLRTIDGLPQYSSRNEGGKKKMSGASVVSSMEVSPFVPLCWYRNSSAVLSLRTLCSVEEFGRRFGTLVSAAYSLQ